MKLLASFLVLLAPLAITGCGPAGGAFPDVCTEIACSGGVSFQITAFLSSFQGALPVTAKLCQDARCGSFSVSEQMGVIVCQGGPLDTCSLGAGGELDAHLGTTSVDVSEGHDLGETVTVTVTITDKADTALFADSTTVTPTEFSPNGPLCAPTCRSATATFTPASK